MARFNFGEGFDIEKTILGGVVAYAPYTKSKISEGDISPKIPSWLRH